MLRKSNKTYKENVFEELKTKTPIVTAGDKRHGFNSLTVSWGGFGELWGKDVAYLFVRKSRYTHQFLEQSDSVTLSFLDETYRESIEFIGTHSGKNLNKVEACGLAYTYDPDYDGAYIRQASYCFKMKKLYQMELAVETMPKEIKEQFYMNQDLHTMFICEIKQYLVTEEDYDLH